MSGGSSLRERVTGDGRLLGIFAIIPSTEVVELIALSGFDFVIVDMEHGPFGPEAVRGALQAAHARGLQVVVRVRAAEPSLIGLVLDAGADGVLVPQISSADAARAVVSAARFAPEGTRGANPYVRASGYGTAPDWFTAANRQVLVMVMVEGAEGVAAVPEILEVPGLDAIFLGPVDMSHSLGVPGQTDHPVVREALETTAKAASVRGVATGVFAPDEHVARRWWPLGVRLVACGVDAKLIGDAFAGVVRAAGPSTR